MMTDVPVTNAPPHAGRALAYRADLDGLRGLSIIMVVFFHNFELYWIIPTSFGQCGVDIFFVLSGYLMTRVIQSGWTSGTLSWARFYQRRISRLFPALIVVCGAMMALGWRGVSAFFFRHIGGNVWYGALQMANVALSPEARGFFAVDKTIKPLVALWSLSMEWQFYLVLPVLLVWTRHRWWQWVVFSLLALGSFAIHAQWIPSPINIGSIYYDPFARLWTLLLGVNLALFMPFLRQQTGRLIGWFARRPLSESVINGVYGWVGGYLVFGTIAMQYSQQSMPYNNLSIAAGVMLLIMAGPSAWINARLLSWRPLVYCGLISYSWYLVHWVVVSMTCMYVAGDKHGKHAIDFILRCHKDPMLMWGVTGIGFALAALMYHCVEKPLRYSQKTGWIVASMAALVGWAGVVFFRA
jgi:peptidoglycan/LPS O-acetylase OafA/YrhL